jgi:hypothetical protein
MMALAQGILYFVIALIEVAFIVIAFMVCLLIRTSSKASCPDASG